MKTISISPLTISAPIPQQPLPHHHHHHHHHHTHRREKVHFAGSPSAPPTPPPAYEYKTRSGSASSTNSTAASDDASQAPSLPVDLHSRALHLLDTLYNKHDLALARPLIHPDVRVSHNDDATLHSRDEYLAHWARRTQRLPDLRARCRECAVDEGQRKVWCVSELYTEPEAADEGDREKSTRSTTRRKESVDMFWFDEEGRLVGGCDWVRSVRRRDDDD